MVPWLLKSSYQLTTCHWKILVLQQGHRFPRGSKFTLISVWNLYGILNRATNDTSLVRFCLRWRNLINIKNDQIARKKRKSVITTAMFNGSMIQSQARQHLCDWNISNWSNQVHARACWQACFFHWTSSSEQLQTWPKKSKTTYYLKA